MERPALPAAGRAATWNVRRIPGARSIVCAGFEPASPVRPIRRTPSVRAAPPPNPVLVGGYLYGDFCSGRIWVVSALAPVPSSGRLVHGPGDSPALLISSFGQDEAGELYVCDLGGRIYRISATAA